MLSQILGALLVLAGFTGAFYKAVTARSIVAAVPWFCVALILWLVGFMLIILGSQ